MYVFMPKIYTEWLSAGLIAKPRQKQGGIYKRRPQLGCSLSTGKNLYMVGGLRSSRPFLILAPSEISEFSLYRKEIEPTLSNYFYTFAIMF